VNCFIIAILYILIILILVISEEVAGVALRERFDGGVRILRWKGFSEG